MINIKKTIEYIIIIFFIFFFIIFIPRHNELYKYKYEQFKLLIISINSMYYSPQDMISVISYPGY